MALHYQQSSGRAKEYMSATMYSYYWRELEYEAKYLLIDKPIRAKLK